MEHAGLFPPLLATCLPAQPAPTPAPPSARPAEPTRIITDPLSGRSYCKGRLLGKVPIGGRVSWGGMCRDSMRPEAPARFGGRGLSGAPSFQERLWERWIDRAGPAPACLSQRTSVSGRPAGPCVGRQFPPRFPGPLRHTQLFLPLRAVCGRRLPAPGPAAECADSGLTSRQEKPVSGVPLSVASAPLCPA